MRGGHVPLCPGLADEGSHRSDRGEINDAPEKPGASGQRSRLAQSRGQRRSSEAEQERRGRSDHPDYRELDAGQAYRVVSRRAQGQLDDEKGEENGRRQNEEIAAAEQAALLRKSQQEESHRRQRDPQAVFQRGDLTAAKVSGKRRQYDGKTRQEGGIRGGRLDLTDHQKAHPEPEEESDRRAVAQKVRRPRPARKNERDQSRRQEKTKRQERQRRRVADHVFHHDEGGAPDEGDGNQNEIGAQRDRAGF